MRRIEWPLHVVLRVAGVVLAVLVLGGAGLYGWDWYEESQARCADGVVKRGPDEECVGVTDGTYAFAGHLRDVERKIAKENAKVVADEKKDKKNKYVSVAYLTSFTLTDDDSNSPDSVRHELEGAYLAQYRHNRGDLAGFPKIRLLLANSGSRSEHWEHTTNELISRKGGTDRLVAVAGLGPSTESNRKALKRLTDHRIAAVASIMTATDIKDIKRFVRVAPTNVDEARAGAAFLKREGYRSAAVVEDVQDANLYASTLSEAFTEEFPDDRHKLVTEDPMTYDSGVSSAWPGELRYIPEQLCDRKPKVVFFAGRGRHLSHFLDSLANRTCQEQKFVVLTGDDTTNLTPDQLEKAVKTGVEVYYTGLAHQDMHLENPNAVSEPSVRNFLEGGLLDQWFPGDSRYDGQDIMGHDAVLTAAHGIQMASRWNGKVTGESVARMFHQMSSGQRVAGASGFISFKNNGDPYNKAVPILRLTADGRSELADVSAPQGEPPQK